MADTTTGFPFMKLPLELRNMVWKELLVMPGLIVMGSTKLRLGRPRVIPINPIYGVFLVSKQIRQEAITTYFGNNEFIALDVAALAEFLYCIGPDACNLIRKIWIYYSRGKNAGKAFKLLTQCGSLRKIHFRIGCYYRTMYRAKKLPFLKRPGIQSLLKIRGLEELDVKVDWQGLMPCPFREVVEREMEDFLQALEILKKPRDAKRQRRLTPNELWSKAPMMTRARASTKGRLSCSNMSV